MSHKNKPGFDALDNDTAASSKKNWISPQVSESLIKELTQIGINGNPDGDIYS